jgi:hypothetical protein
MIGNVVNKERYAVLSTTPLASYEIPFKYWATSQIIVVITSSAGVETTVDTANYTVSTPGDTGTIEFAVGYSFPTGTSVLTIYRSVTIEQQTDYRNGDVLDADVLEKSFDVTISMLQQLNERLDRTVRIPVSDPNLTLEMPSALIRANMLLGFDASGNIIPILTSDIEQKLTQALAAEDSVLAMYTDAGMVAVRTDMATPATSKIQAVAADLTNIDTVATAIANVNAVGTNIANVNAVASNATNINAVNANKTNIDAVAANSANINTVAGDKSSIDTVAGISTQVVAVAADATDIGTVAADLALGASSNIKIVAADKANIDAVALNKTNIDAVADNATNINAVNLNKTNIDTVANDLALGASSNVKKVADAIANVDAVGAAITDVTNVAAKLTEIDSVADNMTSVVSAHTNMAAIIAAPDEAIAAAAARDKAEDWAEEVEDTPVETGKYSAKHHAAKAAASAASAALADAAANKQITIDGTLFQYALVYENGHLIRRFSEVI